MIDVWEAGLQAISAKTAYAPAFALAAGIASSFGPCAAPRLVGLAAYAGACERSTVQTMMTFMAGLIGAYAALGTAAASLGRLIDVSSYANAAIAAGLALGGLFALFRLPEGDHCSSRDAGSIQSSGLLFLFGVSSALSLAPCCASLVAAIAAYAATTADPLYSAGLLATFGVGHGLPAVALGLGMGHATGILGSSVLHEAAIVTAGVLCILASAYYWCLA